MWIASCTKLMTAVACLQCVERGLLDLEDDISTILPDWNQRFILLGFDATGQPKLEKAVGKLTLRMLLSHQSGFGYPLENSELQKFIEYERLNGRCQSELVVCVKILFASAPNELPIYIDNHNTML
jgi:CubicO group peptidase (beta-lactamase class C family)